MLSKVTHKRRVPCAYTVQGFWICRLRSEDVKKIDSTWCIGAAPQPLVAKSVQRAEFHIQHLLFAGPAGRTPTFCRLDCKRRNRTISDSPILMAPFSISLSHLCN